HVRHCVVEGELRLELETVGGGGNGMVGHRHGPQHIRLVAMTGIPDGSDPAELATWLFDRARLGEAQRLAAYVDAGAPVNLTDAQVNTLLMLAAYHGQADTVRALLERGADPDALNDRGQSPLAGAVFKQEADVIAALLEGGADPDAGTPSARAT